MIPNPAGRHRTIIICSSGPHLPLSKQNWALARALSASGDRVVLVVERLRPETGGSNEGFDLVGWPSARPVHWRDAVFFWRLLRRYRPDAILANFGSVNIAMIVGRLAGVPVRAAWYRTVSSAIVADLRDTPAWQERLLVLRKAFVYRQATHIGAVSKAAAEDAVDRYGVSPGKCHVFRTGREDPHKELRGDLPAKAEGRQIVCVGGLFKHKGQDVLIRAIRSLAEAEPDWPVTLDLIGEGPELAALQALARECGVSQRVTFVGAVPHLEALRRMAMAHVMVVPSRTDAAPGVVVEGLGLGVPLVVTAAPGIVEQVGDSSCVISVSIDDHEALARAIRGILSTPALAAQLSNDGRQLFLARFHVEQWIADVSAWLDSGIAQSALE